MRQMAEKYIPKLRMMYQLFSAIALALVCCLASETSDSLLVFAVYIGNPQLTNDKV